MSDADPQEPFGDAFVAYQPPGGGRRLAQSAVLYMDVLGFERFSTAADAHQHLDELLGALQAAREEALTEFTAGPHATTWFTDNVAVAFPVERVGDAAVAVSLAELMAARLQTALAIRGYYWSGGIAVGDVYLEPKFVFGPAIVEAVKLERAEREHSGGTLPRVLLAPTAAATTSAGKEGFIAALGRIGIGVDPATVADLQLRHADGPLTFVSYLDWMLLENRIVQGSLEAAVARLELHRDGVVTALQDATLGEHVHAKYRWLAQYHDAFCRQHFSDHPDLVLDLPPYTTGGFRRRLGGLVGDAVGSLGRIARLLPIPRRGP